MTTHDLANTCPWCRIEHEAATGLTGPGGPEPGNVSLCFNCSAPAVFTDDLKLRRMTNAELAEFRQSDVYQRYTLARTELDWQKP